MKTCAPCATALPTPTRPLAALDGDVVNLSTGETVLSGYQFGAELGGGLLSVTDGSYLLGVCDRSGRMLTDCRYDRVFAADSKRRRARGAGRALRPRRPRGQRGRALRIRRHRAPRLCRRLRLPPARLRLRGTGRCAYNYVLPDGQLAYPVFYRGRGHPRPEHDPHRHPRAKAHTRRRRRAHAHGLCRIFAPSPAATARF